MTRHVTDDDVSLHVEIVGADDGPAVVLVHGLAASIVLSWRATGVLDRLLAHGLRVVGTTRAGAARPMRLTTPLVTAMTGWSPISSGSPSTSSASGP